MHRLWKAMQENPGERTIVFCVSRRHAVFARDWLRSNGVASAAVFSGEGSDGQIESLEALRIGKLQTLCVVDMFNEGLDIPAVDRVIMLRPTESKVIFLQQLGRGLRAAEGKTRLLVIDFVGNHRIFAQRMMHLLSLGGIDAGWSDLKRWLGGQPPILPTVCLLDVDLEARDVIAQFIPSGSKVALETYRVLREELGRRPQAAELFAHSILPRTISQAAGSWFQFTESEGDLSNRESEVLKLFKSWFITVETTSLNKSYKMVVLRVLLDHGDLFNPVEINAFSQRCRRFMLQHPVLRRDLLEGKHELDHQSATDKEWFKWWRKWPIDRWLTPPARLVTHRTTSALSVL
ncbi:MAG: helicase-related protein [Planctomycetota bacterium]|nr:helicase-related protein [Planctomycetota bacterium]